MLHPLQTQADRRPVVDALRKLLAAFEKQPPRNSELSLAWDGFRAAFGDGPAPEGISVDSTGRPDLNGLPALIRMSTGLTGEARDALNNVVDVMTKGSAGNSAWIFRDTVGGPEPTLSELREHERQARDSGADDSPIRKARSAIRSAIELIDSSARMEAPEGEEPPADEGNFQVVDGQVSAIYVGPPNGVDPELADAFHAIAIGIRECTRLIASIRFLWWDEGTYRRLAECVARAASNAQNAYFAVDMRLRRASEANPMLEALNDIMTIRGNAPLDPTGTSGGLNAILTNLHMGKEELFPRVDGKGIIDRMLDQLARVPPTTSTAPAVPPPPNGATRPEGDAPEKGRKVGVPRDEAEILVREWLKEHAKENPATVTRDAVAEGTGVSKGGVSNTAAWKAFSKRRDAEKKPKLREISFTDEMEAVMPSDCANPEELAALMEEQKAEEAEDERRHTRRHGRS